MLHCTRRRVKFCFCIWWTLFITFLLSISILSISLGFIDPRSTQLKKYSSHISSWETSKRQDFQDLKISIIDFQTSKEVQLVQQEQDPSMLTQDTYEPLKTYSPLFYSISVQNPKKFNKTDTLYFNLTVLDKNEYSTIELPALQAYKITETSVLRGACKSLGGSYSGFASCRLLWRITGFCVKISKSNHWSLNYTWQHIGCNGHLNEVGVYEIVEDTDELGVLLYEVRSGFDPLIFVNEEIGPDGNFGLPSGSFKTMGVVYLILAVFLIVEPAIYFKKRVAGQLPESPVLVEFASLKK